MIDLSQDALNLDGPWLTLGDYSAKSQVRNLAIIWEVLFAICGLDISGRACQFGVYRCKFYLDERDFRSYF